MRKRKSVKKADDESDGSEPGVEPEEFQDSGEDWTPDADSVKIFFFVINLNEPRFFVKISNINAINIFSKSSLVKCYTNLFNQVIFHTFELFSISALN